jgi:hypothetical protein
MLFDYPKCNKIKNELDFTHRDWKKLPWPGLDLALPVSRKRNVNITLGVDNDNTFIRKNVDM